MQPTLAPIDKLTNLASIIDELQEDDCGVYVQHTLHNHLLEIPRKIEARFGNSSIGANVGYISITIYKFRF